MLLVYAHPVEGSFTEAVRERMREGFVAAGWTVDVLDLHAEPFDPCVDADELAGTHRPDPVIDDHVERLALARALVFVHPTWWGGQPAVVKGWIDRLLAHPGSGRALRGVRRLVVASPHGSPWWRNAVQGVPGRRITFRLLRGACHPLARSTWLGFYGNDTASDADRVAYLARVERAAATIGGVTAGDRRLRLRRR